MLKILASKTIQVYISHCQKKLPPLHFHGDVAVPLDKIKEPDLLDKTKSEKHVFSTAQLFINVFVILSRDLQIPHFLLSIWLINQKLFNAHVLDAIHVLSFAIAALRKYRDPSDPSRSLIILLILFFILLIHSTNLFCCFSRYQAPTKSVAPSFCINHTQPTIPRFAPTKG